MILFEITTGLVGESYLRAYAWARDEAEAVALFRAKNAPISYPTVHLQAREILRPESPAFCTNLSDHGWEE